MRTKIIQLDIGRGTQWGNHLTPKIIRKICIPSVINYAKKYNYDYSLVTESIYEKKVGPLNFLATKNKHYSFERYLNIPSTSANIVYIDNEVYISKDAEPLPEISGVMAAYEPGETNSRKIFINVNNLSPTTGYLNSGVSMFDSDTSILISEYMIQRAKRRICANGKNTDNMMFNEFILENPSLLNLLNEKWNYMPMLPGASVGLKANFLHLVGIDGKNFANQLAATKIPLDLLIEKVTVGEIKINKQR